MSEVDYSALVAEQYQTLARLASERRSWLGFTGEKLSEDLIKEVVSIARTAPSDANLQPWRFVVLLGKERVEQVIPAFLGFNQEKIRNAGNLILVYADPAMDKFPPAAEFYALGLTSVRDFAIRNASMAAMLLMLASHARGLATRPMVGYDPKALVELLDIPPSWISVLSIAIGYPADVSVDAPPRMEPTEVIRFL
jgi:nitroreductase